MIPYILSKSQTSVHTLLHDVGLTENIFRIDESSYSDLVGRYGAFPVMKGLSDVAAAVNNMY
ncbi:hypothetical protein Mapa_003974 [Marchantia paleacea]|nr:hypothetical protein Mapa_003974 [Marchantia paleacea]